MGMVASTMYLGSVGVQNGGPEHAVIGRVRLLLFCVPVSLEDFYLGEINLIDALMGIIWTEQGRLLLVARSKTWTLNEWK